MKTQKLVLIAVFTLLFATTVKAQRYTTSVVSSRMTFNEVVVNYPVVAFSYNSQNLQLLSDLMKAQSGGRAGALNTGKGNLFIFQRKNDDGSTYLEMRFVFWSARSNAWRIAIDDATHITHINPGVIIFSKA